MRVLYDAPLSFQVGKPRPRIERERLARPQEPPPTGIIPRYDATKRCHGSSPIMGGGGGGKDMVIAARLRQPRHVQARKKEA